MKRKFFAVPLLGLLILAGCEKVSGNYYTPTAAVVCSPRPKCLPIPEAQVSSALQQTLQDSRARAQFRGPQGAANRVDAQRQVLGELITETVIRAQAPQLGIKHDKGEVSSRLDTFKQRFADESHFKATLKQEGLTESQVSKFYSDQVLFEQIAARAIKSPEVGEQQLRSYYEENKSQFDQQTRAAHILVCSGFDAAGRTCNAGPEDEPLARQLSERARKGDDFAALAAEYSKDSSNAKQGGDLGYFGPGQMATEFEAAAQALTSVGQISDPVKTQFGFHVIKLLARGRSFEEVKPEIQQTLTAGLREQEFSRWIRSVTKKARIRVNQKFGRFELTTMSVVPLRARAPQQPRLPLPGSQPGQGQTAPRPAGP